MWERNKSVIYDFKKQEGITYTEQHVLLGSPSSAGTQVHPRIDPNILQQI